MDGLHDDVIRYYGLRGVCYWLLVSMWVVYPDVVFSFSCVKYAVLFKVSW